MHTTRRALITLLLAVIGIAVPMTVSPSGVVLAVLWSLVGVALLGMLLTWEPVARRMPYRLVRTVNSHDLPAETAQADARLADDCERLANELDAWLAEHNWDANAIYDVTKMPPEFSARFDGRVWRCLEALTERRYITRDDLRRIGIGNTHLGSAAYIARYMREWSHRLRRR